ncbi:hypothetical protein GCM10022409_17480 [Hymenobacter glaciei]|uniref:Uncharacterized protein n=2 Tax=Hymenobacter glaciei TaxID=877209 RepID=A0ABP7TZN9_9BACT
MLLPLLSCEKYAGGTCYTGQIVAVTCVNGVLIDVDPRFPIGKPTSRNGGNGPVFLGRNVIAVSNSRDITSSVSTATVPGTLNNIIGQRLYFSAEPDSLVYGLGCYVADGVREPVPGMRLSDISTTACVPTWQ